MMAHRYGGASLCQPMDMRALGFGREYTWKPLSVCPGDAPLDCHHQVPGGQPGDYREDAATRRLPVSALCPPKSTRPPAQTTMVGGTDSDDG